MKKIIGIALLFLLISCGADYTSKQKIVSVGNIQENGTCNIELAHASSPDDPILSNNIRMYAGTKEQCEEAVSNIGRLYTVTYNVVYIKSMRREER